MDERKPPKISIILPTFRRFESALTTARELLLQDYPSFEIVVADQNAAWPEAVAEDLQKIQSDHRVVWLKIDRPGVVKARNAAVLRSDGEVLLFVDDDVFIPDRSFLRTHVNALEGAAAAAVVGRELAPSQSGSGKQLAKASTTNSDRYPHFSGELSPLQQSLWFDRSSTRPVQVCTFCTCNSSISRSAFLRIDGFDESYGGNSYGDDYDLALRLNQAGERIVYEPTAWLIHRRAPIGGLRLTDPANRVDLGLMAKGLWLFLLRHGHPGMYRHLLVQHVLRKTLLIKRNLFRPIYQLEVVWGLLRGFSGAWRSRKDGVTSPFQAAHVEPLPTELENAASPERRYEP